MSSLVPTGLGIAVLAGAWHFQVRSWMPFAVGGAIAAVGIVSWAVMISAYFRKRNWADRMAADATRPWRAEDRWARGFTLRPTDSRRALQWWAGAAAALAAAGTFAAAMPCLASWIALAGAAALAGCAGYRTWRLAKYGASRLELERMPVVPGRRLEATLRCRAHVEARGPFAVTLRCVRGTVEVVVGFRGRRHEYVRKSVLCEETATATGSTAGGEWKTAVPVAIEVPEGLPHTMTPMDRRRESSVVWTLTVSAETPGVDFRTEFELPVFGAADESLIEKRPEAG